MIAAAADGLLGGLEDDVDGAGEIAGLGEVARRAEQHGGVAVMAAGVHHARRLAGVGAARSPPRSAARPCRRAARSRRRARWPRMTPTTPVLAMPVCTSSTPNSRSSSGDALAGAVFFQAQFGMLVQVLAPGRHVGVEVGDTIDDGHQMVPKVRARPAASGTRFDAQPSPHRRDVEALSSSSRRISGALDARQQRQPGQRRGGEQQARRAPPRCAAAAARRRRPRRGRSRHRAGRSGPAITIVSGPRQSTAMRRAQAARHVGLMDRLHQRAPAARQRHDRQAAQQGGKAAHVVLALGAVDHRRVQQHAGAPGAEQARARRPARRCRARPANG